MEKVEMSIPFDRRTITIAKNGDFCINKKFLERLEQEFGDLSIDLRHSADYRKLVFRKGAEGEFRLPYTGRMKHRGLQKAMLAHGYELPARFLFTWDKASGLWIGELEEVAPAPSVRDVIQRKEMSKRSRKA